MTIGKSFTWLLPLTAAALILTALPGCSSPEDNKQLGITAPTFSLKDIDGKEIRLEDFRGKKTVHLIFWATWCPSCLMEIPKLKKLHQAIEKRELIILSIDVGLNDSLERIRKAREQYSIPYEILFDEKGEVSRKYAIMGVPTHIVINGEGKIIGRFNQLPDNPQDYFAQFYPSEKNTS